MRFEINRKIMLEAAKTVAKVAPLNSPVELLNGILVECNDDTGEVFLTATNYEVSIQQKVPASVEQSGEMLIDARLLANMMSALEGEFVTMSADHPQRLVVTGGSCVYNINCLPAKSYPKPVIPFPEESVIMTGICSLAKRTTFAVSKEEGKPALQCVQVKLRNNAIHAAASDGMKMMLIKDSSLLTDEREFLLPGRALQLLSSISSDGDAFEVSEIGNAIVFVRGDMIFTINKLVTGDYMDTASVVKGHNTAYSAVTESGALKEGLDLISIGATGALSGGKSTPVNIVLSGKEIILRCNSEYSAASMSVPAKITTETPDAGFFYDCSSLLKLMQVINGKVKLEIDARGLMLAKTRNEVYFQAPVRPPAKKSENKSIRAKGAKDMKEVA